MGSCKSTVLDWLANLRSKTATAFSFVDGLANDYDALLLSGNLSKGFAIDHDLKQSKPQELHEHDAHGTAYCTASVFLPL